MKLSTTKIRKGKGAEIRAIIHDNDGSKRCHTTEFIKKQGRKQPAEITKLTALWNFTANNGPPGNKEKFKYLTGSNGIYEFKTTKLRVLCFKDDGKLIICSHGFVKQTKKTPPQEIEKAEKEKRLYFEAKERGELKHEE